jgi:hypothetical protein
MSVDIEKIWERFAVSGDQTAWGLDFKDGAIAERIEVAEFDNCIYQFPAFIPWKLYVSMAKQAEAHASELSCKFESKLLPQRTIDKKKIYSLRTPNPDDALEYFQSIITAYIFSYCALEAYVNLRIDSFHPAEKDYASLEQLTKKIHEGGVLKIKSDLVKECSLEEKLFYILPYFLNKKNIDIHELASFKLDFGLITFVRNALVHLNRLKVRTGQAEAGKFETKKIWNFLIPRIKKENVGLRLYPAQFVIKVIECVEKAFASK